MEGTLGAAFGQMAAIYGYRGPLPALQRKHGMRNEEEEEEED